MTTQSPRKVLVCQCRALPKQWVGESGGSESEGEGVEGIASGRRQGRGLNDFFFFPIK